MTEPRPEGWRSTSRPSEHAVLVVLAGEMDIVSSGEFSRRMAELDVNDPAHVVVDLAGLTFIDSSGINALLRAAGSVEDRGGTAVLRSPSPAARRVFEIARVAQVVTVDETREDALARQPRSDGTGVRQTTFDERDSPHRRRTWGRGGLEAVFGRGASAFGKRLGLGALVLVLLLVVLGVLLAWRQYDDGKDHALTEMRARVVLASTVFDTYFAGQLSTLATIANAPSVVRTGTSWRWAGLRAAPERTEAKAVHRWARVDRSGGVSRVSGTSPLGSRLNVSDWSFFRVVMTTGRPFISEGLTTRAGKKRAVVMAVPTRDAGGRRPGVLAGALELRASAAIHERPTSDSRDSSSSIGPASS